MSQNFHVFLVMFHNSLTFFITACVVVFHYFSAVSVVLLDFHDLYQFSPVARFFSTFDHILGCRFVCKWGGLRPSQPPRCFLSTTNASISPDFSQFHDFLSLCAIFSHFSSQHVLWFSITFQQFPWFCMIFIICINFHQLPCFSAPLILF